MSCSSLPQQTAAAICLLRVRDATPHAVGFTSYRLVPITRYFVSKSSSNTPNPRQTMTRVMKNMQTRASPSRPPASSPFHTAAGSSHTTITSSRGTNLAHTHTHIEKNAHVFISHKGRQFQVMNWFSTTLYVPTRGEKHVPPTQFALLPAGVRLRLPVVITVVHDKKTFAGC